ncbi:MAG: hypothetical protein LBT86_10295 [Deltaproteobacteria bacterium]|nr:hypothetical protein [Deltaproteobacteria bacterium]
MVVRRDHRQNRNPRRLHSEESAKVSTLALAVQSIDPVAASKAVLFHRHLSLGRLFYVLDRAGGMGWLLTTLFSIRHSLWEKDREIVFGG